MPRIALKQDRFRELLHERDADSNVAIGNVLGLNNATISRVLTQQSRPGDRFIAAVITTLAVTFDEVFAVVDDDESEAASEAVAA